MWTVWGDRQRIFSYFLIQFSLEKVLNETVGVSDGDQVWQPNLPYSIIKG